MSHQDEKNQAAKAKAKQNETANKTQNQQNRQPGQPVNRPQAGAREIDGSTQLRWSENERNNERNERSNERNNER